ncbi:FAD-binding protein [Rhodococcus fascians]|nr:FAD-binding protein [Rhodococcus fascians]MBY3824100.1 FAD-binding protein [Rhodococcus fascians]MBY3834622.1 FAD-binding protein [Rhodococcus fascians]MBY3863834.1 FAD-binding protein [Rhodococcus fascians]MBY3883305.1 FAD-binding protein [Rhodococcus fascians]
MNAPATTDIAALVDALPADIVVVDPDIVAGYARDQSQFTHSEVPAAVLMPRTTADVVACMAAASKHSITVIPRGAGSGLSGGANASAHSVVLSLHRMTRIRELDRVNRLAVVEPGVITSDLRTTASEAGLFYPPDPGSVTFSTIGGNVATNAGGMCCVKYGVTGDFVLGLEVVLADGRVLRTGRRTVKGVAGYDLTHLLIGSEGTLGIITEITVRLLPAPRAPHTLVAAFPTLEGAGSAVSKIASAGITPSMLEILDRTTVKAVDEMTKMGIGDTTAALLLIQSDDADAESVMTVLETICTEFGAEDVVVGSDPVEAAMLLEARRLALPALERLGDWLLDDVAVPCSAITDLITSVEEIAAEHDLTIGVFGHAGDGNLHPTIIYDAADPASSAAAVSAFDAITRRALALGGTITGEHGVGRLKSRWLTVEHDEVSISVQRALKESLDPAGILNPGAVLSAGHPVDTGSN